MKRLVPKWHEHSAEFWFAADRAEGVEYLRVDPVKKSIQPLFDRARLDAALRAATEQAGPAELVDAAFDFETNEFSFKLKDERWTYSTATHELKKSSLRGLSPDKRWRAFVRDHNLYLEETASGQSRRLTTDGSEQTPYALPIPSLSQMAAQGTSTPVLDAEIAWSPDSQRFATYQMNLAGARHLSAVQSTPPDGAPPRVFDYIYPLTGDENVPTARTVIVSAASGAVTRVESPVKELLYWWGAPEFHWTRDSSTVLQRIADRGYKALRLYSTDAATGRSVQLHADQSDLFVDFYGHDWMYSPEANATFWLSDRGNWKHVLRVSPRGKETVLTSGAWMVSEIAGNDATGKAVFVVGRGREAGRDPYLRHLYRVENDGRKITLLTPEPADHDVSVSPDGRYFVDNISTIEQPTRSVLRSARNGAVVMELQRADIGEMTRRGLRLPEPFTALAADGKTPLYGAMYRPSTFDPGKRYPIVEFIYAGPHAITTPKSFNSALQTDAAFSIAELGFVVVVVDGRGTSGRGRAFLDPAYKNLHAVGLDDHIAAIKSLAATHSYLDVSSVGIYGFSAGGYDVVRAMTERPDFYKVGVSASGNHDNRLDKAVWNEQWMGYPLGPHYTDNSNVTWAPKLTGKLLLAHGELDENVPLAATLRLVDALMAANKPFELSIVPNASHWLAPLPYYNRRRFEFFVRELRPAGIDAGEVRSQPSP